MLTNEWKHFSRGRQKKEGIAYAKWRPLLYEDPYHWAKARVNESAEHSSTRINNVVLCLELSQSALLSHLERTPWFYHCDKYKRQWLDSQTCVGPRPRGLSSRGRGWQRRSAHPPRQWDQPQLWNQCERQKNDIKWKSGHKDKIAFSGQTKGVRRILRLISDHLVPAWAEPLWSPSHRTTLEQASETRRDTAATSNYYNSP